MTPTIDNEMTESFHILITDLKNEFKTDFELNGCHIGIEYNKDYIQLSRARLPKALILCRDERSLAIYLAIN